MRIRQATHICMVVQVVIALLWMNTAGVQAAPTGSTGIRREIVGPVGSGNFGHIAMALPNGNVVITDPMYDEGGKTDIGAAYLYNGQTGAQISVIKGTTNNDYVGIDVKVLSNGNYLIISPGWDHNAQSDAGAVTWASGNLGVNGVVSDANSLVGSTAGDYVGGSNITFLSNGNYVVRSPSWDYGGETDAGAVTWGSGISGVKGVISTANSLIGDTLNDQVGYSVTALSNGNYVVGSPYWNGDWLDVGAVTWGSGATGVKGKVAESNSLVGSTQDDNVGSEVVPLSNGHYVVISENWDYGAWENVGAVTWASGTAGIVGEVTDSNSLIGSSDNDNIGSGGVKELAKGDYVIISPKWNNGTAVDAGAVTWVSGTAGLVGSITASNSLVSNISNAKIGSGGVTPLTNGHYVVSSPNWNDDCGAATWGSGASGISGLVTSTNSLVGDLAGDNVGWGIIALTNGNYVVSSSHWKSGGASNVGAVTWGNGTSGVKGVVSAANSLVGSQANDQVGYGVTPLTKGNYVVRSPYWDNGGVTNVGAVTWGSGTSGVKGTISADNSLIGSTADQKTGENLVTPLSNGNYVIPSPYWDNGAATNAGAVTWGSGSTGVKGEVTTTNSLVGDRTNDYVGMYGVVTLANGNYVVRSPGWNKGTIGSAGAVTWCSSTSCVGAVVSADNSLVGSVTGDSVGNSGVLVLSTGNYLVISQNWDNGAATNAGAITWANGTSGITGAVSPANSLVGSTSDDTIGSRGVWEVSDGKYVVISELWDNGATQNAGAITLAGEAGVSGPVNSNNSVLGMVASAGPGMRWNYDTANQLLVVGLPEENKVVLFYTQEVVYLPLLRR